MLPGTGGSGNCALAEEGSLGAVADWPCSEPAPEGACGDWAWAGTAQSWATSPNQIAITGPKEEVRKIPPGDFLQGTFLVEITLIILQPSR